MDYYGIIGIVSVNDVDTNYGRAPGVQAWTTYHHVDRRKSASNN
jgi:hypothetical protein